MILIATLKENKKIIISEKFKDENRYEKLEKLL